MQDGKVVRTSSTLLRLSSPTYRTIKTVFLAARIVLAIDGLFPLWFLDGSGLPSYS